ncbi:MAG: pantetheine-phosphate adenylyltransferase [Acidimicrobiales bacterium]
MSVGPDPLLDPTERHRLTTALFPGSFDPFHNGHLEIVERADRLFDEVVVAAVRNPQKGEALFSLDERKQMLEESLAHLGGVRRIVAMTGLVVDLAREVGATVIVKGLRAVSDFENEMQMAQMNQQLSGIETLFILSGSTHSFIASRLLREVARFGGDVTALVPQPVAARLKERFPTR